MTSPCFQSRIKVSSLLCNFATSVILSSFVTRKERERKRERYQDKIFFLFFVFPFFFYFAHKLSGKKFGCIGPRHTQGEKKERKKEEKKVRSMIFEKVGELVRNESTQGFQVKPSA